MYIADLLAEMNEITNENEKVFRFQHTLYKRTERGMTWLQIRMLTYGRKRKLSMLYSKGKIIVGDNK